MELTLVVVCGLPGAGKSTLVAKLEASDADGDFVFESIAFDDLFRERRVYDGGAEFDPVEWKTSQIEMAARIRSRITQKRDVGNDKRLVLLVDDNFPYRSQRKRYTQLAADAGVGFGILHVNPPEGICRERNATRRDSVDSAKGEYVPQEVFERMVSMFESPDPNRASWETNTYVLKDSIQKQPDFLQTIHAAFDDLTTKAALALETQREERTRIQCLQEQQHQDRARVLSDTLHLVDLELRKWISTQLRATSTASSKRERAKRLNAYRKHVLSELKTFQATSRNLGSSLQGSSDKSAAHSTNGTASDATNDQMKRLLQRVTSSERLLGDKSVQSQVGELIALIRSKYDCQ